MPKSKIEWTDRTWNPVTGCTRVSAGCDNCYAASMTKRLAAMGQERYQGLINEGKGHFNGVTKCHADRLNQPFSVKKPSMFFVNSMSDLFHESVPFEFIDKVFAVMAKTPHHTYQVLTKRPDRMRDYVLDNPSPVHLLGNVWLGTSVESQDVIERVEHLMDTPAVVRFLSCEPLLGPLDLLTEVLPVGEKIHQVIVGGESGPKARPMHPDWARSLRDQCHDYCIPFFFKQWGVFNDHGKRVGKKKAGALLDGKEHRGMPKN